MRYLVAMLLLLLPGCTVGGMLGYAVSGPPMQPAAYKPQPLPTLVLVENYQAPSSVSLDADRLSGFIAEELRAHAAFPLVHADKLYALRERNTTAYARMKVSEIAKAVGAEQVIYIDLLSSAVEQTTGTMARGRIALRVKVVDAATGRSLWPEDAADGRPIIHETPMTQITETLRPEMLRTQMLQDVAREAARLFYDFKPTDLKDAGAGGLG